MGCDVMTAQSSYPGYATPIFGFLIDRWFVGASPWKASVGWVQEHDAGWTATSGSGAYVGLFPDKQAAGEALVRHAGYEVLR